jgi:hypothetical protein
MESSFKFDKKFLLTWSVVVVYFLCMTFLALTV